MIKILISADYNSIPADTQTAKEWGVDKILRESEINLSNIPYEEEGAYYFVPIIIDTQMGLSYDGVSLALRIYLESIKQKRKNFRIILTGFQTLSSFLITYPFPNVLKCQGIDYTFLNKDIVKGYNKDIIPLNFDALSAELKNIGLTLPESFRSNHSLTNQWSLYAWSKFVWGNNIPFELPSSNSMYFSYLKSLSSLETGQDKELSKHLEDKFEELQGKILLIDDNPKWGEFFQSLFKKSRKIQFRYIGENFKNIGIEEILTICKKEVENFNPEIIFLDYRLSEDTDYEEKVNRKISGARVLESLKGNSACPGIAFNSSIMIFTATSKIENILMLKDLNADGFILKERPEKYVGKTATSKLFNKLADEINYRIVLSQFFVKIASSLTNLRVSEDYIKINEEYKQKIHTTVPLIRNLQLSISALQMDNVSVSVEYLKLMYLEFISLLEMLKKDGSKLNEYIQSLLSFIPVKGFFNDWNNICEIRNAIAHGDSYVEFQTHLKGKKEKHDLDIEFLKEWNVKLAHFSAQAFKYLIQYKKIK